MKALSERVISFTSFCIGLNVVSVFLRQRSIPLTFVYGIVYLKHIEIGWGHRKRQKHRIIFFLPVFLAEIYTCQLIIHYISLYDLELLSWEMLSLAHVKIQDETVCVSFRTVLWEEMNLYLFPNGKIFGRTGLFCFS